MDIKLSSDLLSGGEERTVGTSDAAASLLATFSVRSTKGMPAPATCRQALTLVSPTHLTIGRQLHAPPISLAGPDSISYSRFHPVHPAHPLKVCGAAIEKVFEFKYLEV